ncbi:putative sucrose transport protein [Talaromyces proteolyticus]|uniref:Sucrose transport protein n=1 Tax=Talaromyces proteolyticus TaxID=1131652 RepID=A0AAD4KLM2_9EURO|nr:putative sucrose transport protein [Talaromyces proteolyticus]KAH8694039.1 putative sucrose transport protein [Talaromyces proteolyticus]
MRAASWTGSPSIKGRSEATRMALLTFSLTGVAFTWGVEMSYCTPYLLQLGLTKSRTSLVWVAGPLSGLIMQPLIGVIADRSRSRWGRRRPFMIGGSMIVAFCLLLLGWTSELVGSFAQDVEKRRNATIAVAVLAIYGVDFAINAVQACCRSLIVDTLPISQQQLGSAWANRMQAIGSLIGYIVGSIDMVTTFGTRFGDTQFKQMTLVAALFLIVCVLITCYSVTERVLVSARGSEGKNGFFQVLSQLYKTTMDIPPRIQAICWVQFWSWIGWFPFLFYSTTWVGETYFRYENPESAAKSSDTLGDVGRLGSLSLVIFSSVTFLSSVLLPFGVRSPDSNSKRANFTARPPPGVAALLRRFKRIRPSLATTWLISHLLFAATMVFAPMARSLRFATFLVSVSGIPWAISGWAPFAFMGVEINRLAMEPPSNPRPTASMITSASFRTHGYQPVDSLDRDVEMDVLRLNHRGDDDSDDESVTEGPSTGELAGIYLGVLNVYTTLPQFVGTFISWIVFSLLEPAIPTPGDLSQPETNRDTNARDNGWINLDTNAPNAIAVCLFIGALSALVAAEATRRFRKLR